MLNWPQRCLALAWCYIYALYIHQFSILNPVLVWHYNTSFCSRILTCILNDWVYLKMLRSHHIENTFFSFSLQQIKKLLENLEMFSWKDLFLQHILSYQNLHFFSIVLLQEHNFDTCQLEFQLCSFIVNNYPDMFSDWEDSLIISYSL